jgi:hypothetical protein
MRRALLTLCGLFWFALGLGIALFSIWYISAGTELPASSWLIQIIYPISYESLFLRIVHIIGLSALALLFLGIGMLLFIEGLVPVEPAPPSRRSKTV